MSASTACYRQKAVWGLTRRPVVGALVAVLGFIPPAFAGAKDRRAPHPKLDNELRKATMAPGDAAVNVIVTTNPGCQDATVASLQIHGAKLKARHDSIGAVSAQLKSSDLADFEADACVSSVSVDGPVAAHGPGDFAPGPNAAIAPDTLRTIVGAGATGVTGSGVGVAIIDSGIVATPSLNGRISAFYDFTNGGASVAPLDPFGHGTHIASTIASTDAKYPGVAPGVRLIGLRVLDKNGNGATSDVISALTFATANKAALGIDVINLSLGHPIYESVATDPLVQAVEQAVHAGIVVVVSAGNAGINPQTGLP